MIPVFPRESFSKIGRKPPGLKTRATAIADAFTICCSPPLQRRGFSERACNSF